jgi:hypothetical protein
MTRVSVELSYPPEAANERDGANALALNESGEPIGDGEPVAHIQYARPEAAARVLSAPVGTGEGRSAFFWIRLHNGDLMLGVFPQGETYELLEGEPGTGWGDANPLSAAPDEQAAVNALVRETVLRALEDAAEESPCDGLVCDSPLNLTEAIMARLNDDGGED